MTGFLTTHVLDTARGMPAKGMRLDLFRIEDDQRVHLAAVQTNADGRTDTPILPVGQFAVGVYELVFQVGGYFDSDAAPAFLGDVPIRFGISDPAAHYHVPLLVSPFGYSTYRGS